MKVNPPAKVILFILSLSFESGASRGGFSGLAKSSFD
jgi:hypothetical protein